MAKGFLKKFRRVTDSTSYLPEIDGLRFLAIFSVVIIMHITSYMHEKFYGEKLITDNYWQNVVTGGGNGVALFFVISGFILSLPFAKWRLNNEKPVRLERYYLRRLTRLEPPYIIALLIFFIASVWILHKYSFSDLLPHLAASAVYLHTFIYKSFSLVLPVAWSLEVEVQFYLLAPLIFCLFLVKNKWMRWFIYLLVIAAASVYWFNDYSLPHVFKFLHFFFMGIMLADLYCLKIVAIKDHFAGALIGILSLAGFIFIPSIDNLPGYLLKNACMFFLFHTVLSNSLMKKAFSVPLIAIIGGMCYSIYLLHFGIISFAGQLLMRSGIVVTSQYYFVPFAICFTVIVLVISAVFFVVVEKPFMRPRKTFTANSDKPAVED